MLSTNHPSKVESELTFIHSTEILSPTGLQDRQAVSSAKVTGMNLPNKCEPSGNSGKNVSPER